MNNKIRFKMYKAGKFWLTAGILLTGFGLAGAINTTITGQPLAQVVKADDTTNSLIAIDPSGPTSMLEDTTSGHNIQFGIINSEGQFSGTGFASTDAKKPANALVNLDEATAQGNHMVIRLTVKNNSSSGFQMNAAIKALSDTAFSGTFTIDTSNTDLISADFGVKATIYDQNNVPTDATNMVRYGPYNGFYFSDWSTFKQAVAATNIDDLAGHILEVGPGYGAGSAAVLPAKSTLVLDLPVKLKDSFKPQVMLQDKVNHKSPAGSAYTQITFAHESKENTAGPVVLTNATSGDSTPLPDYVQTAFQQGVSDLGAAAYGSATDADLVVNNFGAPTTDNAQGTLFIGGHWALKLGRVQDTISKFGYSVAVANGQPATIDAHDATKVNPEFSATNPVSGAKDYTQSTAVYPVVPLKSDNNQTYNVLQGSTWDPANGLGNDVVAAGVAPEQNGKTLSSSDYTVTNLTKPDFKNGVDTSTTGKQQIKYTYHAGQPDEVSNVLTVNVVEDTVKGHDVSVHVGDPAWQPSDSLTALDSNGKPVSASDINKNTTTTITDTATNQPVSSIDMTKPGKYQVEMTYTDDKGLVHKVTNTVTVLPKDNGGNGGNGGNNGNGAGNSGNEGGNLPSTGNDLGTALNNTVATIVQHSTGVPIYDAPNGQLTGKVLDETTDWKAFRQYTDDKGAVWYNLGGKQWIRATGVILDAQPSTSKQLKTVGLVTTGSGVKVYTLPGASGTFTGQTLKPGTAWKISSTVVTLDGQRWYRVGTNQFVKADDIQIGNFQVVKSAVVINYQPGYGINVWRNPNGTEFIGKRLETGSAWKVYAKATVNGHVFYNLGGNQWIDSKFASPASSATAQTIQHNTGTIRPGVSAAVYASPTATTSSASLKSGTKVKVFARQTIGKTTWLQVGANQWIHANDVSEIK
ncbi:SLAP domain-containing protein [Lacticaseibacillus saniviri]